MSASNTRTDWALLLLRLAVGGLAVVQSFEALRRAHGAITFAHVSTWGWAMSTTPAWSTPLSGLWPAATSRRIADRAGRICGCSPAAHDVPCPLAPRRPDTVGLSSLLGD